MQAALRPDLCQRAAAARAVDRGPEALGHAAQQEDPEERLQGQQFQRRRCRQDIAKVRNTFRFSLCMIHFIQTIRLPYASTRATACKRFFCVSLCR